MAKSLDGWTIAFDLDGTLVDTAPDLLRALEAVLTPEAIPVPDPARSRLMVGQGARVMIDRAARAGGVVLAEPKLDAMTDAFVALYAADIARESLPFPGTVAALDALAHAGARLSVCTNKRTHLAALLLDTLDLSRRFAAIVGADAAPNRKPHPDHLRMAIARAGGNPHRAIMVGDSSADIGAARGMGAPCVAVRFGYCEEGVETLGADVVIDHFDELEPIVQELAVRRLAG